VLMQEPAGFRLMIQDPQHFLLIRHGQTDANRDGIVQGHQPTRLNATGRRQAARLAGRLVDFVPGIDLLISSDLPRAVETAAAIVQRIKCPVLYDPAWRERPYGTFEGTSNEQRTLLRQRLGLGPSESPGAQAVETYQAGIGNALLDLSVRHPGARCIAVVTHGGACRAVMMMLADGRLPAAPGNPAPDSYSTPNCALTHLVRTMSAGRPRYAMVCINDVQHLEEELTMADAG
jgi:2,3-bisphosphoglycerate-dependent phosphoglycerate mutase